MGVKFPIYPERNFREVIHITPMGDKYPHRMQSDCFCNPIEKDYGQFILIIHNPFDHREFSEYPRNECINKRCPA